MTRRVVAARPVLAIGKTISQNVLNLVAPSTREGRVLKTLLDKLEKIRRQLEEEPAPSLESLVPEGATVKDIETLLAREQVKQADIKSRSFELEARLKAENDRPTRLQEQMALAREKLEAIRKDLEATPQADADPLIAEAKKVNLEARRDAWIAEVRMLEQEPLSRPARLDLLSAKKDLAQLRFLGRAIGQLSW